MLEILILLFIGAVIGYSFRGAISKEAAKVAETHIGQYAIKLEELVKAEFAKLKG